MKAGNFYLAAASALSIAAAASLLSGCEPANSQPHAGMPPPEVAVVTVQPQSVPATFEYIGQTAGSLEVEVRAGEAQRRAPEAAVRNQGRQPKGLRRRRFGGAGGRGRGEDRARQSRGCKAQ